MAVSSDDIEGDECEWSSAEEEEGVDGRRERSKKYDYTFFLRRLEMREGNDPLEERSPSSASLLLRALSCHGNNNPRGQRDHDLFVFFFFFFFFDPRLEIRSRINSISLFQLSSGLIMILRIFLNWISCIRSFFF